MVTPELEKLILAGKASYKTFVAGGAAKSVLQMGTNRFVIITDFVYYPFIPYSQEAVDRITGAVTLRDIAGKNLTQLNIFSQKSFCAAEVNV